MFRMSQPWEDLGEVSRQTLQCKRAKGKMGLACSRGRREAIWNGMNLGERWGEMILERWA